MVDTFAVSIWRIVIMYMLGLMVSLSLLCIKKGEMYAAAQ